MSWAGADEVVSVPVVVQTLVMVRYQVYRTELAGHGVNGVFERPSEAVTSLLIHRLDHEEHTPDLEHRSTNKRRDTAGVGRFGVEL